jgi:hypothetical protein
LQEARAPIFRNHPLFESFTEQPLRRRLTIINPAAIVWIELQQLADGALGSRGELLLGEIDRRHIANWRQNVLLMPYVRLG